MFRHLTLRIKLTLAFLLLAAIISGVSLYQILSIQHVQSLVADLSSQDFKRLNAIQSIELASVELRDLRIQYQQDVTNGDAEAPTHKTQTLNQIAVLQSNLVEYQTLTNTDDNPHVSRQTIAAIMKLGDQLAQKTRGVVDATATNAPNAATLRTDLASTQSQLDQTINDASAADLRGVDAETAEVGKTTNNLLLIEVVLAISTTAMAILLGVIVSAWLSRSLSRVRNEAERMANGDFSRTIPANSNDELGKLAGAFNSMAARLKESYRRIALSSQRDEAMLQSMGEGFLAIDEEGKVALINPVAIKLLGFADQASAIGQDVSEAYKLYDVEDKANKPLPTEKRPVYAALQTGRTVNGVYRFQSTDGRAFLMSMVASPVKVDDKVVGAVEVLRDVTKEREVDRMKTEFISLASHQLRTPLSAIKWFTEMLVSGDAGQLKPEQLDFAKNIADSTERMVALVNALLNISRIESGRIMVDPKPTDLRELVGGIINDLKGKTEEKKQALIISVHDGLPKINLDPRLIGQVYLNLLTNAVKYTPKGGEISVFISKKDDQVISQITDNGYGIPQDQQGRIFQKFFRASNAVKVETDGTGLGLYLIKAVIESSGGKIWFKSEEGKGSTFWFSIPLSGMKPKEGEVTLDA